LLDKKYWDKQYAQQKTGWDIGYVSTPLKTYFDQLTDKNLKILIPGAGNAYEVTYLYENGFKNTFLLDFADLAIENFISKNPDFPKNQIIKNDFFNHQGAYDLIVEHTFFSSMNIERRPLYVKKIFELLKPQGKITGLLFDREFEGAYPPYGGNKKYYLELFGKFFEIDIMEPAYNSIKPRRDKELFFIMRKR